MAGPSGRRVVLADVARAAGTSEASASRALQDDPRIGIATREAVRAAAERLGYVPNAAARSLRARRTRILGLLLDDLADPVHGRVAAGFEAAAAADGYAVFIMTGLHDPAREQRALRTFVEHRADAIALGSTVSAPSEVYGQVAPERVVFIQPDYPALAAGDRPPDRGVVRSDDEAGFAETVRHLTERGYHRLAFVGPGIGASDTLRRRAVTRTAGELGLPAVREFAAGFDAWGDASAVAAELAAAPIDAVVCYDDKLALAVLEGLRANGVDVPRQIAITGFDGIPMSSLSLPRLTTVNVPSSELGQRAVEMLLASLRDGQMPPSETVPVQLVARDSTPPRAGSAAAPEIEPSANEPTRGRSRR